MQSTFCQERSTNEAIRCTNQTHDRNLLATCKDSETNGVIDEDESNEHEHNDETDTDVANSVRKREELVDRLLTILKRIRRVIRVVTNLHERFIFKNAVRNIRN